MTPHRQKLKLTIPVAVLGLFFGSSVYAEGTYRKNFLSDGPESVGGSLGDTLVSYGTDATSVYYNPAALVGQDSNVFIEHAKTNDEASNSWAAIALGDPLMKSGLLWKHEQLPLSSRKDAVLFGLGVSNKVMPLGMSLEGLSLGVSGGWVNENIAESDGSSYFVDLGAHWSRIIGSWTPRLGLALKNVYFSGLNFEDGSETERWPRELRVGGSVSKGNLTALISGTAADGETIPAFGLEYVLGRFVRLRAGYKDDFRMGIGVVYKDLAFAFGYRNGDIQSVPSGSLSYTWGKPTEVDYSNPLSALEAQHRSLKVFLLDKVQNQVTAMKPIDFSLLLKLVAVDPANEDGWQLLKSLHDIERIKCKIPTSAKARRDYLSFAVAYANDEKEAKEYATTFVARHKNSKIAKLVSMIIEKTPPPEIVNVPEPANVPKQRKKTGK